MAQPGLKRLPLTKARASVFSIAVLCGLSLGPSGHAEGSDGISTNVRISATVQDVSVGEALEIVGALAGRPIEVTGAIGDRRISVNLQSVTLEKALDRILYRLNYVVVWTSDDRLSIRILDSTSEHSEGPAGPTEPSGEGDDTTFWYPADETDVLPPGAPGEPPVTIEDLERSAALAATLDPDEGEVVPPSSPEEAGITQAELDFEAEIRPILDPSEIEVLPPERPGEPGLSLAEFQAIISGRPVLSPSEIEVLPPDELGGTGLTLKDLREQLRSMPQLPPASDLPADIVPPE